MNPEEHEYWAAKQRRMHRIDLKALFKWRDTLSFKELTGGEYSQQNNQILFIWMSKLWVVENVGFAIINLKPSSLRFMRHQTHLYMCIFIFLLIKAIYFNVGICSFYFFVSFIRPDKHHKINNPINSYWNCSKYSCINLHTSRYRIRRQKWYRNISMKRVMAILMALVDCWSFFITPPGLVKPEHSVVSNPGG